MCKIKICDIQKEKNDGIIKLSFCLKTDNKEEWLWYKIENRFETFLCDDICDGVVVSLLPMAINFGYKEIISEYPISEKLYYNLTFHVIPQFYNICHRYNKIKIKAPLIDVNYNGDAVAAGMSRGVDSFATFYEYGNNYQLSKYCISHFTYFNSGAHHGVDNMERKSKYSNYELYKGQLKGTMKFCYENGYELIEVDSNLSDVLKSIFGTWSFHYSHTYRNIGFALLLQRGISKYYYSSAFNLDMFRLSLNVDSAQYEKWLLPYLETENMAVYNSNQEWSRLDKIKKIINIKESYKYLCVCLLDIKNCGTCSKCKKTLMELDCLGGDILDRYNSVFDVDKYKAEYREKWFREINDLRKMPGIYGKDYEEIYKQAQKTNKKLIEFQKNSASN